MSTNETRGQDSRTRHEDATRGRNTIPDDARRASHSSRRTTEGWTRRDEELAHLSSIEVWDCLRLLSAGINSGALTCGLLACKYIVVDNDDERARRRRWMGWASSSSSIQSCTSGRAHDRDVWHNIPVVSIIPGSRAEVLGSAVVSGEFPPSTSPPPPFPAPQHPPSTLPAPPMTSTIVGGPVASSGYGCAPAIWAAALVLGVPPYLIFYLFISFIFMYISLYTASSSTSKCIIKILARTDGRKPEKLSSLSHQRVCDRVTSHAGFKLHL